MAVIALYIVKFRALFPAFCDATAFPDLMIETYWEVASTYISNEAGGCYCGGLNDTQKALALNYMTAHLMQIVTLLSSGGVGGGGGGIVTSATIDKVSVSLEPPPIVDQWSYWLNTTPYGSSLLALLSALSVGGFYAGGRPELSAFRKVGGIF